MSRISPPTGLAVEQLEARELLDGSSPDPRAFIQKLYRDLLQRTPQSSEVAAWVASYQDGASPTTIALGFATSGENRGNYLQGLYQALLQRPGDPAGVGAWLKAMSAGASEDVISAQLLGSDEYYRSHGSTTSSWLAGIYQDVLHTRPDEAGLGFWAQILQKGGARSAVASAFTQSSAAHALDVESAYQQLLHRDPDTAGKQAWVAARDRGLGQAPLLAAIAGSFEYSGIPSSPVQLGVNASLGGRRPFPDDNVWNQDISQAPVDPNSAKLIASIGLDTGLHPDFGTTWQGLPNGKTYVVVPGDQPKVPVIFDDYAGESDPGPYPIPPNAPTDGPPDYHLIVLDRDNWKLYELYNAHLQADGWHASSGAIFDLNSNALRPEGWTSADAAGLPIFPGLIRYDEVFGQGEIRHAIRFSISQPRLAHIFPARHSDGLVNDPNLPPMGLRVRLKESFDIMPFPSEVQVILKALKKYGMILSDTSNDWYLGGAYDPRWSDSNLHTLEDVLGSNFEVIQMGAITQG